MKFTIERKALVKMLQCVGKKHPTQTRRDKQVRLSACAARVFVEANQTTGGTEALVFEDGTCFLQQNIFLKVLRTYKTKPNVTIEADGRTLRFFSTTLPVTDYSPAATPPGKFQTFSPIDIRALLGEAPPGARTPPPTQSRSRQAPDSGSPAPHRPGTFPISDEEMPFVQELTRLTRRLCSLPSAAPQDLVGLAHALYALEWLPSPTAGVRLEYCLIYRSGTEASHTETQAWVHIEQAHFILGTNFRTYDTAVGGDRHSTIAYQVQSNGSRSTDPGDEAARLQLHDWISNLGRLLDDHSPDELTLDVVDCSAPNVLPGPEEDD